MKWVIELRFEFLSWGVLVNEAYFVLGINERPLTIVMDNILI